MRLSCERYMKIQIARLAKQTHRLGLDIDRLELQFRIGIGAPGNRFLVAINVRPGMGP